MTVRRRVWLILILAAVPAPAFAQRPCAALDRLATAALETPPFDSVRRALAAGEPVVPGFETRNCRVVADELSCHVTDLVMDHFDGWGEPLPCRGLVGAEISRVRRDRAWHHAYFLGGLRFEYGIVCAGCAGGGHSYFVATPMVRRRPQD